MDSQRLSTTGFTALKTDAVISARELRAKLAGYRLTTTMRSETDLRLSEHFSAARVITSLDTFGMIRQLLHEL
jgi:hypothetical protein